MENFIFLCSVIRTLKNLMYVLLRISPYSVRMWENTEEKNSEYGHFSGSDTSSLWKLSTLLFVYILQKWNLLHRIDALKFMVENLWNCQE